MMPQLLRLSRLIILADLLLLFCGLPYVQASKEVSCGNFFTLVDSSRHSNDSQDSWLIEFYAPWDETGKKLDLIWQELETKTTVNFGRLQFHKCRVLSKYLGIESTRQIVYLRGGNMIRYSGKFVEEDILNFLTIGYLSRVELPLPESLGVWHSAKQIVTLTFSDPAQLIKMLLSGEDDSMTVFLSASLLFLVSTGFVIWFLGKSVEDAPIYSDTPAGRTVLETKDEDEDDSSKNESKDGKIKKD